MFNNIYFFYFYIYHTSLKFCNTTSVIWNDNTGKSIPYPQNWNLYIMNTHHKGQKLTFHLKIGQHNINTSRLRWKISILNFKDVSSGFLRYFTLPGFAKWIIIILSDIDIWNALIKLHFIYNVFWNTLVIVNYTDCIDSCIDNYIDIFYR